MENIRVSESWEPVVLSLITSIQTSISIVRHFKNSVPEPSAMGGSLLVSWCSPLSDEFEKFSGVDFHTALSECTGGRKSDALNLGGPAIVALITAAQILHGKDVDFSYYGTMAVKHRLRLYSRTRITMEERVKGPLSMISALLVKSLRRISAPSSLMPTSSC